MFSRTRIRVPPGYTRRLDLVVPGLNVARGLPLFCDSTVLGPLTGTGQARPGASNAGARLLTQAAGENNSTYREVVLSGLRALYSLGAEVFGRRNLQAVALLVALARERSRGMQPRLRRSTALGLQDRWTGIHGIGPQRRVKRLRSRSGEDTAGTCIC